MLRGEVSLIEYGMPKYIERVAYNMRNREDVPYQDLNKYIRINEKQ